VKVGTGWFRYRVYGEPTENPEGAQRRKLAESEVMEGETKEGVEEGCSCGIPLSSPQPEVSRLPLPLGVRLRVVGGAGGRSGVGSDVLSAFGFIGFSDQQSKPPVKENLGSVGIALG